MIRITRQIALFLSIPLAAIGCQSAGGVARTPLAQANLPMTLPAGTPEARTASALIAADRATGEVADELRAIDNARAIVQHNMCNAYTTAYKATSAGFQNGGKVTCQVDFTQGSLENTSRPLDIGIQGSGFFAVWIGEGSTKRIAYTRNGNFIVDKRGELVLNAGDGYTLVPTILIPSSATDISIGIDGTISVLLAGQTAKQKAGQVQLSQFGNPNGLELKDGTFFYETEASGPPTTYTPGEGGTGDLLQGFLEAANVDLRREVMRLHYLDQWRSELLLCQPPPPTGR
jgi:flagellar basal body rod protein FlgG